MSDEHAQHGGLGIYISVTIALIVLTLASFAVANSPIMDTPMAGWLLMMAISVTKAMCVITVFMHLMWEANWKYVLTIPASFMSALLVFALVPDVYYRYTHAAPVRMLHAAEVTAQERDEIVEVREGESELGAKPKPPTEVEPALPGQQYFDTHEQQHASDSH